MDREAGMLAQDEGRNARERKRFLPLLGAAAKQLLDLERRWDGRPDAVGAEIERQLDACAWIPREVAGERLVLLLRLRDLRRFVESETGHRTFKLAVLDAALRQREPAKRWEGVRTLLLAHLDLLLSVPAEQVTDALKRDVSAAESPLGRMLRLCALLNLEAAGECPPPAVALRFARGRFPEHAWVSRTGKDEGGDVVWHPVTPLARWEYLAVDLMEHVCRSSSGSNAEQRRHPEDPVSAMRGGLPGRVGRSERAYCRLDVADADAMQLPLLPIQEETLLGEVLGYVQRALGPEGMRQAALILLSAAEAPRGGTFILDRARLIALCRPAGPRAARECSRKLESAMELLSRVVVSRTHDASGTPGSPISEVEQVRSTRLLTVLERHGGRPGQPGGLANPRVERWTVLADPILWNEAGRPIGDSLRNLPSGVFGLAPRQHPYALALGALLTRWFDEQPGIPMERSLQGLIRDAGLAFDRANPNKAAEVIKRDLHALHEARVLGGWRVVSKKAPILDATLRLHPPRRWTPGGGERGAKAGIKRAGSRIASASWHGDPVMRQIAGTTMIAVTEGRQATP